MLFYFTIYLLMINTLAFILYGIDKQKARKNHWRIRERTLIGTAVIGGSIGALLGMRIFHHKTRHPKFVLGVPAILILQFACALWFTRPLWTPFLPI